VTPAPPRVESVETYWTSPPPRLSARCEWWQGRIRGGWRPNGRIRTLGYYPAAQYFGVYIWEWINVLYPLTDEQEPHPHG
jgi:hypothetical protein